MASPPSAPPGTWPEVFPVWYDQAFPVVVAGILRQLRCPIDRATDGTQDAALEIHQQHHSLNFPEYRRFFVHFRMVASQRTQRALGRAQRELPFHDLLVDLLGGVEPNRDDIEDVRSLLNQLTPEDQEVLMLRYMEELKYEEIAAQLGIPLTTA